jgi:hypothetical protein
MAALREPCSIPDGPGSRPTYRSPQRRFVRLRTNPRTSETITMAEPLSLLEFLKELLSNVQLRDYFAADPAGALEEYGLENLSPEDVHDALVLIEDNQTADFSRDYNTGQNAVQYTPPPAPPVHHGGGDDHQAAIEYLNTYITNNYVDDADTIVDNSVNQQIDTGGGDFDQYVDIDSTVASGDGAVAAGDDIEDSTIVTGDGNQVGDGNVAGDGNVVGEGNQAVTGNDNTTSFGEGDATSTEVGGDVTVGAGGGFASGGDATVTNTDSSTNDSYNDFSDNSTTGSYNDVSDNSVNDSGNVDVDVDVDDSGNDNSTNTAEDSFNDNSDNSTFIDNTVDVLG